MYFSLIGLNDNLLLTEREGEMGTKGGPIRTLRFALRYNNYILFQFQKFVPQPRNIKRHHKLRKHVWNQNNRRQLGTSLPTFDKKIVHMRGLAP